MTRLAGKRLVKNYNKKNVVDKVSIHVDTGEVVGLLGPNGAGKTTSFYMLVGLIKADSGEVFFDDINITHYPMHQHAKLGVGYLAQEPSVFRKLTVADNLRAVIQLRSDLTRGQAELLMEDLLDEFNISHLREQMAIGLSGGERRKVEIARALASEPQFILLDEPFAGIDPLSVIALQQIITHLKQRGIGVLMTEHKERAILEICDRAYILSEGKVIAEGSTKEIIANDKVRKIYLGEKFSL